MNDKVYLRSTCNKGVISETANYSVKSITLWYFTSGCASHLEAPLKNQAPFCKSQIPSAFNKSLTPSPQE